MTIAVMPSDGRRGQPSERTTYAAALSRDDPATASAGAGCNQFDAGHARRIAQW